MPVTLMKLSSGKVRVSTPNGVKAKGTTMYNALRLKSILNNADKKPVKISPAKPLQIVNRIRPAGKMTPSAAGKKGAVTKKIRKIMSSKRDNI